MSDQVLPPCYKSQAIIPMLLAGFRATAALEVVRLIHDHRRESCASKKSEPLCRNKDRSTCDAPSSTHVRTCGRYPRKFRCGGDFAQCLRTLLLQDYWFRTIRGDGVAPTVACIFVGGLAHRWIASFMSSIPLHRWVSMGHFFNMSCVFPIR